MKRQHASKLHPKQHPLPGASQTWWCPAGKDPGVKNRIAPQIKKVLLQIRRLEAGGGLLLVFPIHSVGGSGMLLL